MWRRRIANGRGDRHAPARLGEPLDRRDPAHARYLGEHGYGYVLDWCMDDQPVWLKTRGKPLLSVPYSQEINDSSTIIGRQASATDFAANDHRSIRRNARDPGR
jgi:hypothetical protein